MTEVAATSRLDACASVTAVPVCAKRTVCYEFDTRASDVGVAIPYLVVINGKIDGKLGKLDGTRKIKRTVDVGSKVALYLNSDVHPDHRSTPVYAVEVGKNNVLVRITEKRGHHAELRPVVGVAASDAPTEPGAAGLDRYQAALTGNIWMTVSHRYTEAEANALLGADTPAEVRQAIGSIYRGLKVARLSISVPSGTAKPATTLRVAFEEGGNPQQNIAGISTTADVLPRTHPRAYEVLFNQACKLGITDMLITSCWRPCYGAIVHRAGLGLDVCYIATATEKVRINRIGLLLKGHSSNPYVSDNEKTLREEWQKLSAEASRNKSDTKAMDAANEKNLERIAEMEKNQPQVMRDLRAGLSNHDVIKQLLDPWYMNFDTGRHAKRSVNEQASRVEQAHAHHLHITIKEPRIYE